MEAVRSAFKRIPAENSAGCERCPYAAHIVGRSAAAGGRGPFWATWATIAGRLCQDVTAAGRTIVVFLRLGERAARGPPADSFRSHPGSASANTTNECEPIERIAERQA